MGKAKVRHNRTSKKGKTFSAGKGGVKRKTPTIQRNTFIDVYWDSDLSPPTWMTRRYYVKNGSRIVEETILTDTHKEAEKEAKKWIDKIKERDRKVKFVGTVYGW